MWYMPFPIRHMPSLCHCLVTRICCESQCGSHQCFHPWSFHAPLSLAFFVMVCSVLVKAIQQVSPQIKVLFYVDDLLLYIS